MARVQPKFDDFMSIITYLSHFHPIYSCADELKRRLVRVNLPPRTAILRPGQVCNNLFFIESGSLQASEVREGKEYINWILSGPAFAQSARSFHTQSIGAETIESVEDSVVTMLNSDDLYYMIHNYHDFSVCMFKLMTHITVMREVKFALAMTPDAELRVLRLATLEPQLFERVPLNALASYLSMTPETLSRITHKKKLLQLMGK